MLRSVFIVFVVLLLLGDLGGAHALFLWKFAAPPPNTPEITTDKGGFVSPFRQVFQGRHHHVPAIHPSALPPYPMNVPQLVYLWMTSVFVTCLIVADVIGVKLFEIQIPFKVTFLLSDLINEYYGPRAAKRTVYIGLAMSIIVFVMVNIAQGLPFLDRPFNVTPEAFNLIFGSAKLMYAASLIAYLAGQLADIWLFGIIKRLTGGKMLWLRATGSTIISQMLDSFVVSYIAFGIGKTFTGQVGASLREIWTIAITGYMLKFVAAALITPILYIIRGFPIILMGTTFAKCSIITLWVMHEAFGLQPLPPDHVE